MIEIKIKECKIHGETDFAGYKDREYIKFVCKKCNVDKVRKRRRKLKLKAVEYKGSKCEKCGYDKCVAALEFHHLDPSKKDFGIAHKGYTRSWIKVKEELDKCIMVCSNCHKEIHDDENLVR